MADATVCDKACAYCSPKLVEAPPAAVTAVPNAKLPRSRLLPWESAVPLKPVVLSVTSEFDRRMLVRDCTPVPLPVIELLSILIAPLASACAPVVLLESTD